MSSSPTCHSSPSSSPGNVGGSDLAFQSEYGEDSSTTMTEASHANLHAQPELILNSGLPSASFVTDLKALSVTDSMIFGDHDGFQPDLHTEQFVKQFNSNMSGIEEVQRSLARSRRDLEQNQVVWFEDVSAFASDFPEFQTMDREFELIAREDRLRKGLRTVKAASQFVENHRMRYLTVSKINLDHLKNLEEKSVNDMFDKATRQFQNQGCFESYTSVRDLWTAWQKAIVRGRTAFQLRESQAENSILQARFVLPECHSDVEDKKAAFSEGFSNQFENCAKIPSHIWDWYLLCGQQYPTLFDSDSHHLADVSASDIPTLLIQDHQILKKTDRLDERSNSATAKVSTGATDHLSASSSEVVEEVVIGNPLYRVQQLSGGNVFYSGIGPNKPDMSGVDDEDRELFDQTLEDRRYPSKFGYFD